MNMFKRALFYSVSHVALDKAIQPQMARWREIEEKARIAELPPHIKVGM